MPIKISKSLSVLKQKTIRNFGGRFCSFTPDIMDSEVTLHKYEVSTLIKFVTSVDRWRR